MSLARVSFPDTEEILNVDGKEQSSNPGKTQFNKKTGLHLPLNVCTWPELARLTLAASLIRDLGIHDFDVIQKLIAGDVENESEKGKMKLQTQAVLQLIILQNMTSIEEIDKLMPSIKKAMKGIGVNVGVKSVVR